MKYPWGWIRGCTWAKVIAHQNRTPYAIKHIFTIERDVSHHRTPDSFGGPPFAWKGLGSRTKAVAGSQDKAHMSRERFHFGSAPGELQHGVAGRAWGCVCPSCRRAW